MDLLYTQSFLPLNQNKSVDWIDYADGAVFCNILMVRISDELYFMKDILYSMDIAK